MYLELQGIFLDSILLHYFMCNNSSMSVIPGLCKNSGEY